MNAGTRVKANANKIELLFCKFSSGLSGFLDVLFPLVRMAVALLLRLVSHVVRMSSKKEMFRVCALRVVALMEHMHPIWDVAKVDNPRNATRCNFWLKATKSDHSVAFVFVGKPFPTAFRFFDLGPKALLKSFHNLMMGVLQYTHYKA